MYWLCSTNFTLVVDPVPTATETEDIELCDNDDDGIPNNGIVQTFDLEAQTPVILGTQNSANFTVTYHLSYDDALNGLNTIVNTNAYENSIPF